MDTSLNLTSPAKLNLFLHINGRRGPKEEHSGYHELQTVFQILDRGDEMFFTQANDSQITITPEFDGLKLEDNLIYQAAALLKEAALLLGITPTSTSPNSKMTANAFGAHIHIDKRLPMGGGVGGGSSNAATTLIALNHIWQLDFSEDQLAKLGAKLGADVPVFIHGHSAWAEGIGDELSPVELPESWYLILSPNCHVSTIEIFSHERLTRDTPKQRIAPALEGQAQTNISNMYCDGNYRNDCEALVSELKPEIREALKWLNQYGEGRLTGTGACCFSRFNSEAEAQQVLNEAQSKFKGFIAKGVNLSPAIQRLNEAKRFARNPS